VRNINPIHGVGTGLALVHGHFTRANRAAAVKVHGWAGLSWICHEYMIVESNAKSIQMVLLRQINAVILRKTYSK
jgi:cytochrome b subunit of formate dehydrogenase